MKKVIGFGCVALVLCFSSGCGSKSADALVKDQTKLMNDYADAVDKKDDKAAKDLDAKILETNKKIEELKLSPEEKKKVIEANPENTKAALRYAGAKVGASIKDFKLPDLTGKKKDKDK